MKNYGNYAPLCVRVIATHADINCPIQGDLMPEAGAMIAFVKAATGREPDLVVGKPNQIIAEMAATKLSLPLTLLVMVGDRLYTDIAMGHTSGVFTVLVLSGETQPQDIDASTYQPDAVFAHLGELASYIGDKCLT